MGNLSLAQITGTSFKIDGSDKLPHRQLLKFGIFLNSLGDATVDRSQQSVLITTTSLEKHVIAGVLGKVVDYFDKQQIDIVCDAAVSRILDESVAEQEQNENVLAALKAIKTDSEESKIGFNEFCAFCDKALRIELRPYQYKAAYLLSVGRGGFDFSVPGAGKTIITYAAYAHMKAKGVVNHIFVIGPRSSYNAWFDEFFTCFGEHPDFENLAEWTTEDCKAYLTASPKNHKEISFINIDKVRLLTKQIVKCVSSSKVLLVIDEGHKIKSPDAQVTNAVLEITKHAEARIILTGTPMPNGYEDLYSLTKAVSPFNDLLPYNYNQLRLMTINSASSKQAATIREKLSPYYSRISKKYLLQTKELLPANYHIVPCQMGEEQRALYERLNSFFGKLSDEVDEDLLMTFKKAILIRKMQISANPALLQNSIISSMDELKEEYAEEAQKFKSETANLIKVDRELMAKFGASSIVRTVNLYSKGDLASSKNAKAVEIAVSLVQSGKKVLIWDIFVKNMDILKDMLIDALGETVEIINGSVTGIERQVAIKRFREGKSMVLLANPATLAESISLHKVCQNAIYVNRNFNAAQFIQSKDRIHRINMPVGTTADYYLLINSETVDSCVDERLNIKENRMLAILDADDIEVGGSELEEASIMSNQDIEESYLR